jgi:[acyl-carrier-protein] S-malonyltransferase
MSTDRTALLFPGQGAQSEIMFDGLRHLAAFRHRHATLSEILGCDLLGEILAGRTSIHANRAGSLMTVLASAVSLDLLRDDDAISGGVAGAAGYSVGQWTALYAGGSISFEQLVRIVERRASFMDRCVAQRPGAMIAVIGLSEAAVEDCCARTRDRGLLAAIANYNAPGQYTVSAEAHAVPTVIEDIRSLKPIKCIELQAAGPWHSQLMAPARDALADLLGQETFRILMIPAVDNVTGEFLPGEAGACRETLADQVCKPVRWSRGIETLIGSGVTRFIEVGYGNMLTRFGFFINRTVQHVTFQPASA